MNPSNTRAPRRLPSSLLPVLFAVSSTLVFGHPGHGPVDGFGHGFDHPLSGWDHALAMIAVGIWAAQLGARWLIPGAFVAMMSLGAVCGHMTGAVPGLDQGIAASVLILGLLIARTVRLPIGYAVALVGLFALFHGVAHGAEMPASAGGLAFGMGFVAATVLLHAGGVALGVIAAGRSARLPQLAGWAIAAAGVAIATI